MPIFHTTSQDIAMAVPQDKKAQDLYVLTPELLQRLLQGRNVTITWTMPGYARILPISDSIPRSALIIFSRFARQKLVNDEPFASTLLINGGVPGAAKRVLAWIMESCEKGKVLQFEEGKKMGFMTAWQAYKMAIVLDIPILQTQLEKRMKAICCDQVNALDCREVFISTDPDKAKYKDSVAESIAKALCESRLRERTEISMFRSQSPDFNEAVTKFLDPLVAARSKGWVLDEKARLLAELKEHKVKGQKMSWKEAKKEEMLVVGTGWTIVEEEEPEEDWFVVSG